MFRPDRLEAKEEREGNTEKLLRFLEGAAGELRNEGVPVEDDLRIDMSAFHSVFSAEQLATDAAEVERLEGEWYGEANNEERRAKRRETTGERLETLKTAIFHKNLKTQFLVVRASRFDDVKHGVDNVLVERTTGNVVGALDEVGESSGPEYERKKEKVLARNMKERGATLTYGVGFREREGRRELALGPQEHVPFLYLALPKEQIEEGLAAFDPGEEQSGFEQKLFQYFRASLEAQVRALELQSKRLHPELKKRLDALDAFLQKLKGGGEK